MSLFVQIVVTVFSVLVVSFLFFLLFNKLPSWLFMRRVDKMLDSMINNPMDTPVTSPPPFPDYKTIMDENGIACEHPKRKRESVAWDEVIEIGLFSTSDGPWLPDLWFVFSGKNSGCSVPTSGQDSEKVWDEIKKRFPGFDYEAFISESKTYEHYATLWTPEHRPS